MGRGAARHQSGPDRSVRRLVRTRFGDFANRVRRSRHVAIVFAHQYRVHRRRPASGARLGQDRCARSWRRPRCPRLVRYYPEHRARGARLHHAVTTLKSTDHQPTHRLHPQRFSSRRFRLPPRTSDGPPSWLRGRRGTWRRCIRCRFRRPGLSASPRPRRQGASFLANLRHPHIVPVHFVGSTENPVFMVMPRTRGQNLRTALRQESQFEVPGIHRRTPARTFRQGASGLRGGVREALAEAAKR
jgi:hypothetical protein